MCIGWGFEFDDALQLRSCAKHSIAGGSEQLRGCIGRVVVSINGIPVSNLQHVHETTEECEDVSLQFDPVKYVLGEQRGVDEQREVGGPPSDPRPAPHSEPPERARAGAGDGDATCEVEVGGAVTQSARNSFDTRHTHDILSNERVAPEDAEGRRPLAVPVPSPLSPRQQESLALLQAAREGRDERLRGAARKGELIG